MIFLANQPLAHSRYGDCVLQILIFRKTFERPDLVVSVLKRMKSLPLWMIEKMTLRTYMHVWRIAYEAYRTKDSFEPDKPMAYHGLTDESIFISHNSKGREIENYDLDSEEGYLAWD